MRVFILYTATAIKVGATFEVVKKMLCPTNKIP